VSAVSEVAIANGLQKTVTPPGAVVSFSQSWNSNGDGHARGIHVSVLRRQTDGSLITIEVFEWLAWGHNPLGKTLLADLRKRLSQEFGADSLF
jgi:hypothetical protein